MTDYDHIYLRAQRACSTCYNTHVIVPNIPLFAFNLLFVYCLLQVYIKIFVYIYANARQKCNLRLVVYKKRGGVGGVGGAGGIMKHLVELFCYSALPLVMQRASV